MTLVTRAWLWVNVGEHLQVRHELKQARGVTGASQYLLQLSDALTQRLRRL